MPDRLRTAALLLTAALCIACSGSEPAPLVSSPGASPTGAAAVPSSEATEEPEIVVPEEFWDDLAFRKQYGLRADLEWIREVAARPDVEAARREFGVPLTKEEFADLISRRWDPDLHTLVREYGSVFPEFAGAGINLKASGVWIRFADDVDRHRRALRNLVPAGSAVEVVEVEWSLIDLEAFREQVDADAAWIQGLGVTFEANVYGGENYVRVSYKGDPQLGPAIEERFGDQSWLVAEWDGPLPWRGPRGDLIVKVTDPQGRPVPGLLVEADPVDEMVSDPGETVFGTDKRGICDLGSRPAAEFRIRFRDPMSDPNVNSMSELKVIKTVTVTVAPGGTVVDVVVPAR